MAKRKAKSRTTLFLVAGSLLGAGALLWWLTRKKPAAVQASTGGHPLYGGQQSIGNGLPYISLVAPIGRTPPSEVDLSAAAQGSPLPREIEVQVYNGQWRPQDVTIPVGGTVTFWNRDKINYSVTIPGMVDFVLGPGERLIQDFANQGTFVSTDRMSSPPYPTIAINVR